MFVEFFKNSVSGGVSRLAQKFKKCHAVCVKNFIVNLLELYLNFMESILKVGGVCKVLARLIRSSNKANSLHSTWLNPSDMALFFGIPVVPQ